VLAADKLLEAKKIGVRMHREKTKLRDRPKILFIFLVASAVTQFERDKILHK